MAALLRSRGTTVFEENIFISRYRHVLLNNPTSGYGILIRNMLSDADSGCVENAS